MNDYEIIEEHLNTILKYGDIYDIIADKKDRKPFKHHIILSNILLLSRILFAPTLIIKKIATKFAPLEKVYNAQNAIRDILGINIDFINTNFKNDTFSPSLYLWYHPDNLTIEQIQNDLSTISKFCEIHHISKIILPKSAILKIFNLTNDADLVALIEPNFEPQTIINYSLFKKTETVTKPETISFSDFASTKKVKFNNMANENLILLNQKGLLSLLNALKKQQLDIIKINEISRKSNDPVIKKALTEYYKTKNLGTLKATVKERLTYYLNNINLPKYQHNQKIYETIEIQDEYVKITSINSKTQKTSTTFTTLLNYLEIPNNDILLQKITTNYDDKETLALAALHLYLTKKSFNLPSTSHQPTYYDQIYNEYKTNPKTKNITGLNTKKNLLSQNIANFTNGFLLPLFLIGLAAFCGLSIDIFNVFLFNNPESTVMTNVYDTLLFPYQYSLNYELDLLKKGINTMANLISEKMTTIYNNNLFNFSTTSHQTGDAETLEEEPTIYALLDERGFNVTTNCYYANGYASSVIYKDGVINYDISYPSIPYENFKDENPILTVRYEINRNSFSSAITEDLKLDLPLCYYPLDKSYVITKLEIIDALSYEKGLTIDAFRAKYLGNSITSNEAETLRKLKHPQIWISYGSSKDLNNPYTNLPKEKPYSSSPEVVKAAIIRGLGLAQNASLTEIYTAIKSKNYSLTPLEDSHILQKIKSMSEEEFYENIASLDSLICNLAAFLAVNVDNNLIYTVGYADNNHDGYLKSDEAHAWAIYPDSSILDVTPSLEITENLAKKDKEKQVEKRINIEEFTDFITWSLNHHIPEATIVALILFFLSLKYGPKASLTFKISQIQNLLHNPNIANAYAEINATLYGGINLPCQKTPSELVTTISKNFQSFTKEELEALKKELAESKKDKELTKLAQKLVNEIPFITEHEDEINNHLTR